MDDRLREIEGTLARTSERKNTILYKLSKRKAEEERLAQLGVKKLPTNPSTVTDEKVVKYVLSQLKQETGDKIAKIRNDSLVNIERDGEATVRMKNDEINKLLARKDQWEKRLCELTNKEWAHKARKRSFFGCARQLPEALEAAASSGAKRPREADASDPNSGNDDAEGSGFSEESILTAVSDDESALEIGQMGDDSDAASPERQQYAAAVAALLGTLEMDGDLVEEEKIAERQYRDSHPFDSTFLSQFRHPESDGAYSTILQSAPIPSEADLKKQAVDDRKTALQARLAALRQKS